MSALGTAAKALENLFSGGPTTRDIRRRGVEEMKKPEAPALDDLLREAQDIPESRVAPEGVPEEAMEFPGEGPVPVEPYTPVEGQELFGPEELPSNLNRNYLDTTDAVKEYMDELQGNIGGGFREQRRGVRTHEMTREAADSEAVREDVARLIGKDPGTAWNAEQLVSGRNLLLRTSDELQTLSTKISAGNATQEDMDSFLRTYKTSVALQRAVQGGIAEAGRALNAMQIRAAPSSRERMKQLQNSLAAAGGQDNVIKMAKAFEGLDDPAMINNRVMELESAWMRWGRAIQESWINSILSGPPTHLVNMIGNLGAQTYEMPVRGMTGVVGAVRQALGSEGPRVYAGEVLPQTVGRMQGMLDTFIAMGRERLSYFEDLEIGSSTKFDIDRYAFTAGKLAPEADPASMGAKSLDVAGSVLRVPGTMLSIEDDLFKSMVYRGELNALAYRIAMQKGVEDVPGEAAKLMSNPTREMHEVALAESERLTFTEGQGVKEGWIASLAQSVQSFTNKHPAFKYLAPFIRTPANLAQYFNDNSLLGPLTTKWRQDFAAGGIRQDAAIARLMTGTAITVGVWSLVADGKVSGRGPSDYVLRSQLERSGWQPNSIKVGDTWYMYDRTDPVGTMFGIVANAVDVWRYSESEEDWTETLMAVVGGIIENYADKTYLSSISDAFALINSSHKAADMQRMIGRTATGLMPYSSFVGSIRRGTDENLREVRTPGSFADTLSNTFLNKIPGYSETLSARLDWKGDPVVMNGGAAYRALSPIRKSAPGADKASFELVDNGVRASKPTHILKFGQVQYDLLEMNDFDDSLYQQYKIFVGKARHDFVKKLMRSKEYKKATAGVDSERSEGLQKALSAGLRKGRGEFIKWYNRNKREDQPYIDDRMIRALHKDESIEIEGVNVLRAQEGLVPEENRPEF